MIAMSTEESPPRALKILDGKSAQYDGGGQKSVNVEVPVTLQKVKPTNVEQWKLESIGAVLLANEVPEFISMLESEQ
jgi:hypothetical protein